MGSKAKRWTDGELEMLRNSIVPPGRTCKAARAMAFKKGISFRPNGGKPRKLLSRETEDRIVESCRKCGNHKIVASMFGISRNTVIEVLKRTGHTDLLGKTFTLASDCEHIVFEGHNFSWKGGCWTASCSSLRRSGKYNLTKILWERWYGVYPGEGYNIVYKDGNHYNLSKDNLQLMTISDAVKLRYKDPMYKASNLASISMASLIQRIQEVQNPGMAHDRALKSAATRRKTCPDFGKRVWEARKKNAEKRGYFYTPEAKKKMSIAHKGKTSPHKGHFKENKTNA